MHLDRDACYRTLPFRPPYDWPAMRGFLAARAISGVESAAGDGYARSIAVGPAFGTVAVQPVPGRNALAVTIRFPAVAALPVIVARLRLLFDLGADPAVIAAHLAEDPALAPLVAARPGLRVPGAWDGFELAVRAILGQQISVAAATRLAGKLVAVAGSRLPDGTDGITHAFPTPNQVIAAGDLGAVLGMPRSRAAALTALARAASADPSLFAPGQNLEAAIARLRAVPGIGEWTAQYIAMRALREPDAFPAADIGLLRAMATPAGRPTPAALLARSAAWRPWRAYAALHLWASGAAASPGPIKEETDEPAARPGGLADRDDTARL
jgi:AraC family transcriptional regulator of adaptative response / DNA-3-methyladenine glycosylase II